MPLLAVAWSCVVPKAALLPPYPRRNSPLRSGTWPPTTANSSGYARGSCKRVAGRGESRYKERARSPFQTLTPGHGASSKGGYHHAEAGFRHVPRADTGSAAGLKG